LQRRIANRTSKAFRESQSFRTARRGAGKLDCDEERADARFGGGTMDRFTTRFVASRLIAIGALSFGALSTGFAVGAEELCDARARRAKLDFTLRDVAGNDVRLADYSGHVIVLDFWATWCAPCRVAIPDLVEIYERYRDRGVVVLGVSVNDPVTRLKPFVREFQMSYPVLIGEGRYDLQEALGPFVGFPTSFVIARDGTICRQHTGIAAKADLERAIASLL
jgi:cytochrome c biogenesis protein CcmG/thiol:disulfide interchange protein DsbE